MTQATEGELVASLQGEVARLREEVARLRKKLEFLETHPSMIQGLKGERIAVSITGGHLTAFAESYDIRIGDALQIEVKYSKINTPKKGYPTRRWNWSKPLGHLDRGKDYDFLLLIGEKDERFDYGDNSPYVFFLVPRTEVPSIMTSGRSVGANVQINTCFEKLRSPTSKRLRGFHRTYAEVEELLRARTDTSQPVTAPHVASSWPVG